MCSIAREGCPEGRSHGSLDVLDAVEDSRELLPLSGALLSQGAESRIYTTRFFDLPCIVKQRFRKRYRHPSLDAELTKRRIVAEARAIVRARRHGIDCPALYFVDMTNHSLYMEHVYGFSFREFLELFRPMSPELLEKKTAECQASYGVSKEVLLESVLREIGRALARLHNCGLIHGDITPCNILLRALSSPKASVPYSVTLIDFGLSYTSVMAEDRAVDLYVLERALLSFEHCVPQGAGKNGIMSELIEQGYLPLVQKADAVMQKIEEVRLRGRKRLAVG